jgi:hypothetical protein
MIWIIKLLTPNAMKELNCMPQGFPLFASRFVYQGKPSEGGASQADRPPEGVANRLQEERMDGLLKSAERTRQAMADARAKSNEFTGKWGIDMSKDGEPMDKKPEDPVKKNEVKLGLDLREDTPPRGAKFAENMAKEIPKASDDKKTLLATRKE